MGRPDLSAVRTTEILDAFERCVARFGLEGSSLERVAEEAGMKRSILRHYVGNRDDLIRALADRVITKYRDDFDRFREGISDEDRVDQILDFFFPTKPRQTTESVLVIEALIAAGEQYPDIQELVLKYVDDLVSGTAKELSAAFSSASRQHCWEVAYGVICICFNHESLAPLKLPPRFHRAARRCSEALIESLSE